MKYLLLFTALITTANALDCQCSDCAAEKTCTIAAGKCYSIEREIAIGKDNTVKQSIKGCQDNKSDICNQEFILMSSDKDFYLISNIICCDKDSCNKDSSPTLNKTLPSSDLVCPSCFALEKKICEGKSMKCGNLQKKCFSVNGTITKDDKVQHFNAKGCAVENTIFKKDYSVTVENTMYTLKNVELVEAKNEKPKDEKPKDGASQISSCLSFAILLPSVLWFLLDSSLY